MKADVRQTPYFFNLHVFSQHDTIEKKQNHLGQIEICSLIHGSIFADFPILYIELRFLY